MKLLRIISAFIVVIVAVIVFIWASNPADAPQWTGFGPINDSAKETIGKTLWDWLDLLIIPVVLAIGGWLLSTADKLNEEKRESDRQKQEILTSFRTTMSNLILSHDLLENNENAISRIIARSLILSSLRLLDPARKVELLQILAESNLISSIPLVSLFGADFRGCHFEKTPLAGVEIRGAYFEKSVFLNANLQNSDFTGCNFNNAVFKNSNLDNVNFSFSHMEKVKFINCDKSNAIFENVRV